VFELLRNCGQFFSTLRDGSCLYTSVDEHTARFIIAIFTVCVLCEFELLAEFSRVTSTRCFFDGGGSVGEVFSADRLALSSYFCWRRRACVISVFPVRHKVPKPAFLITVQVIPVASLISYSLTFRPNCVENFLVSTTDADYLS